MPDVAVLFFNLSQRQEQQEQRRKPGMQEQDLCEYYQEQEKQYAVDPTYMERQVHVTEGMRTILVNWFLNDLQRPFGLSCTTIFLAVSILDRFLEKQCDVRVSRLQLVGATALWIATKLEERKDYMPELYLFVHASDKAYTVKDMHYMEKTMLETLDYRVYVPTTATFLRFMIQPEDDRFEQVMLLAMRCLTECALLRFLPSEIAYAVMSPSVTEVSDVIAMCENTRN